MPLELEKGQNQLPYDQVPSSGEILDYKFDLPIFTSSNTFSVTNCTFFSVAGFVDFFEQLATEFLSSSQVWKDEKLGAKKMWY